MVLVPVKAFDLAKGRLADSLTANQRRHLAQSLAANVVAAANPSPTFVVCDNDDVARWALAIGVNVMAITAPGLNPSMTQALDLAAADGFTRAVICHGDLPLARDLGFLTTEDPGADVAIVTDRHRQGTNVMAMPIRRSRQFQLQYGANSCHLHQTEARRVGWSVRVIHDDALGWDLDTPEDLEAFSQIHPELAANLAGQPDLTHLNSAI